MQIIDRLAPNPPTNLKKIELIACLHGNRDESNHMYLYESNWENYLRSVDKIERIGQTTWQGENIDIILTQIGNSSNNLFLGYWNDGIV